jgi:hypothetical protein
MSLLASFGSPKPRWVPGLFPGSYAHGLCSSGLLRARDAQGTSTAAAAARLRPAGMGEEHIPPPRSAPPAPCPAPSRLRLCPVPSLPLSSIASRSKFYVLDLLQVGASFISRSARSTASRCKFIDSSKKSRLVLVHLVFEKSVNLWRT